MSSYNCERLMNWQEGETILEVGESIIISIQVGAFVFLNEGDTVP